MGRATKITSQLNIHQVNAMNTYLFTTGFSIIIITAAFNITIIVLLSSENKWKLGRYFYIRNYKTWNNSCWRGQDNILEWEMPYYVDKNKCLVQL